MIDQSYKYPNVMRLMLSHTSEFIMCINVAL